MKSLQALEMSTRNVLKKTGKLRGQGSEVDFLRGFNAYQKSYYQALQ